jgi:8-oxo-dGTP pyrophosphatase MutT (NUDIX family)
MQCLMCSCKGELLVLLRNSAHNHNTWGLPGGNADHDDEGDLMTTAVREAKEEMTTLPNYEVVGQVSMRVR